MASDAQSPYIPQLNYVYPDKLNEHMIAIKVVRNVQVDNNYPYLDKTFKFNLLRRLTHLGIYTLVFPLAILRFGIKIEGRDVLRRHRKLFKDGAMTVSNHIHMWDMLFVLRAIRYRMIYFPLWRENLNGPSGGLVRMVGGIPIPRDLKCMKFFNQAFDEVHAQKRWIHAYPEMAMFHFFQPIRPFKKGVFTMAWRYKLPVIPMAFSYREPHFPFTLVNLFRSMIGNQKIPMITLRIGEPIMPDASAPRTEAVQKLRKQCHEAIVSLAGIQHNPYPAEGD